MTILQFMFLIYVVVKFFFCLDQFCSGAGIDLSSLCIVQGKVCWDLYINGLVVSSDGNVLDALGAAIKVHELSSLASINHITLLSLSSIFPIGVLFSVT